MFFMNKLGNGEAKVREFLSVIPLALPRPGRVEEGINKFSSHLAPHFQSMLIAELSQGHILLQTVPVLLQFSISSFFFNSQIVEGTLLMN